MTEVEITMLVAAGRMNSETDAAEICFRRWGYMPLASRLNGEIVYVSSDDYYGSSDTWTVVDVNNKPVGVLRACKNARGELSARG
jgi:hypothetical protein